MLIYIICNLQNQLKKYDIISYKLKQISKDIKQLQKYQHIIEVLY